MVKVRPGSRSPTPWSLTQTKNEKTVIDAKEVQNSVRQAMKAQTSEAADLEEIDELEGELAEQNWKDELKQTLLQLEPAQFERLAQRLLREAGFIQVQVTGKTGDGGIDGKGIIKIAGLISFHAMFQCKRYQGSVTASHIRDFRGALQGRADKGLFITTGKFTRSAEAEAQRDGAPPIDLIDGDDLAEKLKEFGLGVKTEQIEKVIVNHEWFAKM